MEAVLLGHRRVDPDDETAPQEVCGAAFVGTPLPLARLVFRWWILTTCRVAGVET
ncbi:hypothetical protein [Cobetia sp. 5-11-6-3]|uniref:hypothetical protein n=1 Tax=Cobetia sp. 5-11-6-3 TaxID=2737458 RepID=UPI0015969005|nr:hypothetical protein [Cobetia sp. 5-11-6-3]